MSFIKIVALQAIAIAGIISQYATLFGRVPKIFPLPTTKDDNTPALIQLFVRLCIEGSFIDLRNSLLFCFSCFFRTFGVTKTIITIAT